MARKRSSEPVDTKVLFAKKKYLQNTFYETDDFKNLMFICKRMQDRHTLKNQVQFMKFRALCIERASRFYLDVGYNKATGRYDWLVKLTMNLKGPEYKPHELNDVLMKYWGDDYEPDYNEILAHI